MAANISAFNTVFSYDLWQQYVRKGRPDDYYLKVGRWATVGATGLAIGTAFIAASYGNLMNHDDAGSTDLGDGAGDGTVGLGPADGEGHNDRGRSGASVIGIRRSSCAPMLESPRFEQP
ncbi:hypothetical protein AB0J35_18715 [Nonomuraea angiospora]|uniref:hypothetical protein n=1 Tax=Nonomuraea angiospora TaxID=46172 RepID=UPI003438575D